MYVCMYMHVILFTGTICDPGGTFFFEKAWYYKLIKKEKYYVFLHATNKNIPKRTECNKGFRTLSMMSAKKY